MILTLQLDCGEEEDLKNFLYSSDMHQSTCGLVNTPGCHQSPPNTWTSLPLCSSVFKWPQAPKCMTLQASMDQTQTEPVNAYRHLSSLLPWAQPYRLTALLSQSSHVLLEKNKNPGFCLLLLLLFLKYYKKNVGRLISCTQCSLTYL